MRNRYKQRCYCFTREIRSRRETKFGRKQLLKMYKKEQ